MKNRACVVLHSREGSSEETEESPAKQGFLRAKWGAPYKDKRAANMEKTWGLTAIGFTDVAITANWN